MTVWSNSMITKDCLHCRLHLRWCQFLRKVPAMLSSLQKQSCFASTRAAWRPGCRFWRITTNSWSHSCTGWGSCWSRWVLRPFFLRFRYSYFPNRMWNVINNNNLPQNHICRDWSAKYIKLFCRLQVASGKITLHYSYLVLLFYSEFKSVVCVDVFTWKKEVCIYWINKIYTEMQGLVQLHWTVNNSLFFFPQFLATGRCQGKWYNAIVSFYLFAEVRQQSANASSCSWQPDFRNHG